MSAKTQVSFGIVVLSSKLLGKGFRCSVGKVRGRTLKFLLFHQLAKPPHVAFANANFQLKQAQLLLMFWVCRRAGMWMHRPAASRPLPWPLATHTH